MNKVDPRRTHWGQVFNLSESQIHHRLTWRVLEQLDACRDDAARRLLIFGIGNPENPMVFDVASAACILLKCECTLAHDAANTPAQLPAR